MPDSNPSDNKGDDRSRLGIGVSMGLEVLVGVGLGLLVGHWIDKKLDSSPWGLLIGAMLGLASGMYLLIKDALQLNGRQR